LKPEDIGQGQDCNSQPCRENDIIKSRREHAKYTEMLWGIADEMAKSLIGKNLSYFDIKVILSRIEDIAGSSKLIP